MELEEAFSIFELVSLVLLAVVGCVLVRLAPRGVRWYLRLTAPKKKDVSAEKTEQKKQTKAAAPPSADAAPKKNSVPAKTETGLHGEGEIDELDSILADAVKDCRENKTSEAQKQEEEDDELLSAALSEVAGSPTLSTPKSLPPSASSAAKPRATGTGASSGSGSVGGLKKGFLLGGGSTATSTTKQTRADKEPKPAADGDSAMDSLLDEVLEEHHAGTPSPSSSPTTRTATAAGPAGQPAAEKNKKKSNSTPTTATTDRSVVQDHDELLEDLLRDTAAGNEKKGDEKKQEGKDSPAVTGAPSPTQQATGKATNVKGKESSPTQHEDLLEALLQETASTEKPVAVAAPRTDSGSSVAAEPPGGTNSAGTEKADDEGHDDLLDAALAEM